MTYNVLDGTLNLTQPAAAVTFTPDTITACLLLSSQDVPLQALLFLGALCIPHCRCRHVNYFYYLHMCYLADHWNLPLSSQLLMSVFDRCHHQIKGQLLISHFHCQHRENCPQSLVQIKRTNVGCTHLHRCSGMPC